MDSQYTTAFKAKLERFAAGLSHDPRGVVVLPSEIAEKVFAFLVECACLAQSDEANRLGSTYLLGLPRPWAIDRLKALVNTPEYVEDDYAYRRLCALCEDLEPAWAPVPLQREGLFPLVVAAGLQSSDVDVRELAARQQQARSRVPSAALVDRPEVWRLSMPMEVRSLAA